MGDFIEGLKDFLGINKISKDTIYVHNIPYERTYRNGKGINIKNLNTGKSYDRVKVFYRSKNNPGVLYPIKGQNKRYVIGPDRINRNTSPTKTSSEKYEDSMMKYMISDNNTSKPEFDIPFIKDKAITVNGNITSNNVLDSIAKYVDIHNNNPVLAENPIIDKKTGKPMGKPRKVTLKEALGLFSQETNFGAHPYFNIGLDEKTNKRALSNANYIKAYGSIPAEYLGRDFHYNDTKVNRNTPPLLDAIRYYAEGDYNRGDINHTSDVQNRGNQIFKNDNIQSWYRRRLESRGKLSD